MGCLDSNLVWYNRFFTAYGNILLQGFIINFPMIQARKISNHSIHSTIPMEFIHHETMNVDHFPVAPWVFHISSHPLAPCPPCPELLARLFVAPPARTASPDGRPVRWICPMAAGRTQRSGGVPGWNDRFYTDWSSETGDLTIENVDLTRSDLEKPAGRESNPQLICCYKWI